MQNSANTSSYDIDISDETLKEKFQLKRSKFERIIRKKKAFEAKQKKMRQNRRRQCSEIFHTSSLKFADENAHVNDSVNQNSNTVKKQKGSLQQKRFGTNNAISCNNYYAKRFCSLSMRNSSMSKSASNRLDILMNTNDNIFDKLKKMNFEKSPNYDVCKSHVFCGRDNIQPVKRKRKDGNDTELDSSNKTKRFRFDN